MDRFTEAYIECAIWSSSDTDAEGNDIQLDQSGADISAATLAEMETDCADFQASQAALLEQAYASDEIAYDEARAGHDFWLTRNRHGAGFWDRGLGEIGRELTVAAHCCGGIDLYIGDDGEIHA